MSDILSAIANDDDYEIVELIKKGADPNTCDEHGKPALHIAAEKDLWMCTAALLNNGADPDSLDSIGRSTLFIAATLDKETIASQLRDHGANIRLRDHRGLDALKTAVIADKPRLVWWLLCYGADPEEVDDNGWNAVMHAASAGSFASLEKLLEKELPVTHSAPDGRDAMFLAVENGHYDVVRRLRKAGSPVDKAGPGGKTPLHIAAAGRPGIAAWLIDEGACIHSRTLQGREPLSMAAESGNTDSMLVLLRKGADTDSVDEAGNTALHHAAASGQLQSVKLLSIAGASRDRKNKKGLTPLETAGTDGHQDLAAELTEDMRAIWLMDPVLSDRWQVAEWIAQVGAPLDSSHLEALLNALQIAQETRRNQEQEAGDLDLVEKAYPRNPVEAVEGALSRLEDPRAIQVLTRRIQEEPSQSHAIAKALVAIGSSAIDALLEMLRADPPRIANAISVGVARGGSEKQLRTLFEVVGSEVACGAISQAAGQGRIPGAKGIGLEMLKPALENRNSMYRSGGYTALGALKLKGARSILEAGLTDPDSIVRQSACAGLQYLGDPAAAPAIIDAWDKLSGRGRMTLLALGEPAMDAVEAGLSNAGAETRSHLLRLLAEVRGAAAAPVFRKSLKDSDSSVQRTALALLTPHCTNEDVPLLSALLGGDLWRESAKALGRLGSDEALRELERAAAAIASKKRRSKEEKEQQEFFELLV